VAFDKFGHLRGPMRETGLFCTIERPVINDYHRRAKLLDFGDLDLLPILRLGQVVEVEEILESRTGSDKINTWKVRIADYVLARAMGFVIAELPVHWTNSEASRVHPVSDSTRMFFDVVRVRRLVKRTMHEFPYR